MSTARPSPCRPCAVLVLLCLGPASAERASAQDPERVAIAVSYFENTSRSSEHQPLAKGFADMLITDLAQSGDLTLVERARLEDVLGEVELQKNPYFDKRGAVKLGRGLGAAYIVTGAFLVSARTLRLDVRVVDVGTGEIVLTVKQSGDPAEFFAIEQAVAGKLLAGLGAKLTLVQKKRVGAQSTRSLDAFRAYSDALDARDRGDASAERVALQRALSADPGYGKVKARLAALESKVAALEKSGGRIIDPTRAYQLLHNARIQKSEGDYRGARASLERAVALEPQLIDPWLALADIDRASLASIGQGPVARSLRPLVAAFARRDAGALHQALGARKNKHRVHAAAFLFALVGDGLPAKRIDAYAMAHDAAQVLLAAEKAGKLEALFVDHLPLLRAARDADQRHFGAARADQLARPARVTIRNNHRLFKPTSWWDVRVTLYERPARNSQPVLTITRDRSHPHWRSKQLIRRRDRVHGMWARYSKTGRERVKKGAENPDAILYRFDDSYEDPRRGGPMPGVARFGEPFEVPAGELSCQDNSDVITGALCWIDLEIFKPSASPGPYRLTVSYRDAADSAVRRDAEAWIFEFATVPHSRVVAGSGISLYGRPEREVIFLHPTDSKALEQRLLGPNKFTVAAETWIKSYLGNIEVYYDIDYALLGGKRPADGHRAWIRYRNRIIRRGHHIRMDRSEAHLPLPDLTDGVHWLCMTAVHDNGARSPEAECHRLDIKRPD